jgi:hypothetical protein
VRSSRCSQSGGGWRQAVQPTVTQPCSWIVFLGPFDHLGHLSQLGRRGRLHSRRAGVGPGRRQMGCARALVGDQLAELTDSDR